MTPIKLSTSKVQQASEATATEKLTTTLKYGNFKRKKVKKFGKQDDNIVPSYQKCCVFFFVFLSSNVCITSLGKNFTIVYQNFNGFENIVNQSESFENVRNVEIKAAMLARIMNAITLQNEFLSKSMTMKKVIAEALGVQAELLFDSINKTDVLDSMNTVKIINSLAIKTNKTINHTIENLSKLEIYKENVLPKSQFNDSLFKFNVSTFGIKKFSDQVKYINLTLSNLLEYLQSPTANPHDAYSKFGYFSANLRYYDNVANILPSPNSVKSFAECLQNMNSFVLEIEQYFQLTDQTYLKNLVNIFEGLKNSSTSIEPLLQFSHMSRVEKQLNGIARLFSTSAKASDMQALIGFPRGSKDMVSILKDLDDDWLKKVLNGGKKLDELEDLLVPVHSFNTQIESLEIGWAKLVTKNVSKFIRQSINSLWNVKKWNNTSIINSLTNLNQTLTKLRPIDNLNNSLLIAFRQLLSSSQIFTNFSKELLAFPNVANLIVSTNDNLIDISIENRLKKETNETLAKMKEHVLAMNFDHIRLLISKTEVLNNQQTIIKPLLTKFKGFQDAITNETLTNLRNIVESPKLIKSDIAVIRKHINLLNTLYLEECSSMNNISKVLFAAHEWEKIERDFRKKIEGTKNHHRLLNIPYAREITYQLIYSQRTMFFYRRDNLGLTIRKFVAAGTVLANKMTSLPPVEKYLYSEWINVFPLNSTMNLFLSEIHAMASIFPTKVHSLKMLGNALSALDTVYLSTSNFSYMMKLLDELNSSSIGQSKEVLDFAKVVQELEGLRFVEMRKKGLLPILLAQTDTFFQSFFSKQLEPDTFWLTMFLVGVSLAVVAIFVLILVFLWIRKFKSQQVN